MSPDAAFVRPGPDWLPRLMVIDGCNVGRSACGLTREAVSCAGLLSVIRWLLLRDFDCVVFLPVVYNNAHNANTTHAHLLPKLEEAGLVTFTPARASNGDRRAFINYDDLYVTTLAERHGGCVLSGDRFNDILAQETYSAFHHLIRNRVLDVKFLFLPHEVVHFGDDVFYKAAPELYISEDLSTRAKTISRKIHSSPDDPDFARVTTRRQSFTHARRQHCIRVCDDLLYELLEREAIRPMRLQELPRLRVRTPKEITFTSEGAAAYALARDDCVWQPGNATGTVFRSGHAASGAAATLSTSTESSESAEDDQEDALLIDFSDSPPAIPVSDSASPTFNQSQLATSLASTSPAPICRDPFDLIEEQLRAQAGSPRSYSHVTAVSSANQMPPAADEAPPTSTRPLPTPASPVCSENSDQSTNGVVPCVRRQATLSSVNPSDCVWMGVDDGPTGIQSSDMPLVELTDHWVSPDRAATSSTSVSASTNTATATTAVPLPDAHSSEVPMPLPSPTSPSSTSTDRYVAQFFAALQNPAVSIIGNPPAVSRRPIEDARPAPRLPADESWSFESNLPPPSRANHNGPPAVPSPSPAPSPQQAAPPSRRHQAPPPRSKPARMRPPERRTVVEAASQFMPILGSSSNNSSQEQRTQNNSGDAGDAGSAIYRLLRKEVERSLLVIFPRDVVQSVLTMNASNNVDFLAEQCLQLSSTF